jgi:stage V sporulation protein T
VKATGIVRRIDDLGRVVIPKEIRRTLKIREGDPLEIFTDKDGDLEIDFITKLFEGMDNDTLDKIAEGFGILMKNISEMEK